MANDSVVGLPDRPNCIASSSEQKDVFKPLSKNAYVLTVLSLPGALTFTGTTASPTTDVLVQLSVAGE